MRLPEGSGSVVGDHCSLLLRHRLLLEAEVRDGFGPVWVRTPADDLA